MNNKSFCRIFVLFLPVSLLLVAGCATKAPNQPFTAYVGQEKIHLKVGVNVTADLRMAKNDKGNIPIGESIATNTPVTARHNNNTPMKARPTFDDEVDMKIATNAPVMARHIFDEVVELRNGQLPPSETVAAILTPKVAYSTRTVGATGGGESIVDLKVEWTFSDANGNPIWVDTIDGRSSAATGSNPEENMRDALDHLLLKSRRAILSANAIQQFVVKIHPELKNVVATVAAPPRVTNPEV